MIRTIIKTVVIITVLVVGTLWILNETDVAKPGTISYNAPDREPCRRVPEAKGAYRISVNWIWTTKGYGWGCTYEYDNPPGRTATVVPMPTGGPGG